MTFNLIKCHARTAALLLLLALSLLARCSVSTDALKATAPSSVARAPVHR